MKHEKLLSYDRTLLGELLLSRGLVLREQIDKALSIQQTTRQRLGEVLVGQGWLCERHLSRVLRQQRRLRLALGVVSLIGFPALALAEGIMGQRASPMKAMPAMSSMVSLDEQEMREVSGGSASTVGRSDGPGRAFFGLVGLGGAAPSGFAGITGPVELLLDQVRKLLFIEADITVVNLNQSAPEMSVQSDGSLALSWPSINTTVALDRARIGGASLGDVFIGVQSGRIDMRLSTH